MLRDTIGIGAGDFAATGSFDCQAGSQTVDGKSDAAEATAKVAIEIKKTEMQPRGN
jgi:hypothetical protein